MSSSKNDKGLRPHAYRVTHGGLRHECVRVFLDARDVRAFFRSSEVRAGGKLVPGSPLAIRYASGDLLTFAFVDPLRVSGGERYWDRRRRRKARRA